jgi:hypothetical protein
MKRHIIHLVLTCATALGSVNSWAQSSANDYPNRPLRFVVGFAAGSSTDIVSRLLAQKMSEHFSQPFVVEQKVGGGGAIANDFVVKSAPDGLNMVLLTGGHPTSAAMIKKLPYDPIKDFGMVSTVVTYPMVISVAQESNIKSLSDLIAQAKAKPGQISFSSIGTGSLHHLLGEWLSIESGISMLHVPFKGAAPAMMELLGGRTDVMIETATFTFGQLKGGKIRALAVSSELRSPMARDIPTVSETLPGIEFSSWLGVAVAPGTPKPIIDKLNHAIRTILDTAEIKQKFSEFGGTPTPSTPEEMRARIEREITRWRKVVEIKNIEKQ